MLAICSSVLFILFTINALVCAAMRWFLHVVLSPELFSVDMSEVWFPNTPCGMVSVDMSEVCFHSTPCVVMLMSLSSGSLIWFTRQSLMCVAVWSPELLSVHISEVWFPNTPGGFVSVNMSKVCFLDTPCGMVLMSLSSVLFIWVTLQSLICATVWIFTESLLSYELISADISESFWLCMKTLGSDQWRVSFHSLSGDS